MWKWIARIGGLASIFGFGLASFFGFTGRITNTDQWFGWIRTLGSAQVSVPLLALLVVVVATVGILGWCWFKAPRARKASEVELSVEARFKHLHGAIFEFASELHPRVSVGGSLGLWTSLDARKDLLRRELWPRLEDLGIPVPSTDASRKVRYEFLADLAVLARNGDLDGARRLLHDNSRFAASRGT